MKIKRTLAHTILCVQLLLIGLIFYLPIYNGSYLKINFWSLTYSQLLGAAICGFGAHLFLSSIFTMKSNFEIRAEQRKSSRLVTNWPFSMVRNPMYLSGFVLTSGWALFFDSILAFSLGLTLLMILIVKIKFEEHFLKKQFGQKYIEYMSTVPRLWPHKLSIWK